LCNQTPLFGGFLLTASLIPFKEEGLDLGGLLIVLLVTSGPIPFHTPFKKVLVKLPILLGINFIGTSSVFYSVGLYKGFYPEVSYH